MSISRTAKIAVAIALGITAIIGGVKSLADAINHLNGWHVLFALSVFLLCVLGLDFCKQWLDSRFAKILAIPANNLPSLVDIEKKERIRAIQSVYDFCNAAVQRIDQSIRDLSKQTTEPPLKQRAIELANDLFALLEKQGPKPSNPLSSVGADNQRLVFDAYFDWQKSIYYKYMAYFRDRVVKIDFELAAACIFTKLEHREIDPPLTSHEVDIKKIAEGLLLTASQMPDATQASSAAS